MKNYPNARQLASIPIQFPRTDSNLARNMRNAPKESVTRLQGRHAPLLYIFLFITGPQCLLLGAHVWPVHATAS